MINGGAVEKAPYIQEGQISAFTWSALNKMYPQGVPVPVPIEEIAEQHCKIPLEFEELDKNILGYCDFGQQKIWLNSRLQSNDNERLRFTIAHELGHYSCHSRYAKEGGILYSRGVEFYQQNHSRLERQANLFAGYLLMPRPLVMQEWVRITGSESPYLVEEERKRNAQLHPLNFNDDLRSMRFTNDIAETFEVSYTCASIQLERLRLLY